MKMKWFTSALAGVGLVLLVVCEARAQTEPRLLQTADAIQPTPAPRNRVEFEYAVKFVCGRSAAGGAVGGIVAPGPYFTAINIHNPSFRKAATFRHKFVAAFPNLKPGPIVWRRPATLRPDEAAEIDCPEILSSFEGQLPTPSFLKGFVVLLSPIELDVVAVYTAGQPTVATLHTERVPARSVTPCGDLRLDLSTGSANWTVQGPGSQGPVPVTVVSSPSGSWKTPPNYPGSKWVSISATGVTPSPATYTFRHCFCLCAGYEQPDLALEVFADNEVRVFLNGLPAAGIAFKPGIFGFTGSPGTEIATAENYLVSGENCLTAVVKEVDSGSPTGLILGGTLAARGGACSP